MSMAGVTERKRTADHNFTRTDHVLNMGGEVMADVLLPGDITTQRFRNWS